MEEVEGERVGEEGRGNQLREMLSASGGDECAGENE